MAIATALVVAASTASAHDFWVNAFSAHDAEAQSTTVVTSMGWGNTPMPISEFISGARLSAYAIVTPDGSVMPLPYDASANDGVNAVPEGDGLPGLEKVQSGDAFVRRVDFGRKAATGAWRAHAANPAIVYSTWTTVDGDSVSGGRFADELTDGETLVSSSVSVRSSDAYWMVGAWQTPEAADVPLQIIPQFDLSTVSVGDEVVVAVYRNGERVSAGEGATFRAIGETSEIEGMVDENGDLSLTLIEPGYWILRASQAEPVAEAGPDYADFEGRIEDITFTATIPVDVAQ